jgi:hypothetical protein
MNRFITTTALIASLAVSSLALAATAPTPAPNAPDKHATVKKCHDASGKSIKCEKKAAHSN